MASPRLSTESVLAYWDLTLPQRNDLALAIITMRPRSGADVESLVLTRAPGGLAGDDSPYVDVHVLTPNGRQQIGSIRMP